MSKWNTDNNRLARLEREQIQSELSTLRAQIHPHFLFNTLNTVYALSYVDGEASRKALAQMSRLLRHQLYEAQQTETTLTKELAFIKDYVNIMRLRVNEKVNIALHLPETVNDLNIAPMILICYIENVFKHGLDDKMQGDILINIEQRGNTLFLMTKNKVAVTSKSVKDEGPTGIGMQNTQRRLELLYSNRHHISIKTDNNEFELTLILQLI
jgi:LytS/YehU family sensor histidine kinase